MQRKFKVFAVLILTRQSLSCFKRWNAMMQSFVHSIWWIKEPLLGKWPARLNGSNRSGGLFCGFLFVKIWYDLTYEYRNDKTFKSNAPRGGSGGYSQKGIHFACRTCRGGGEGKSCSSAVTRGKNP